MKLSFALVCLLFAFISKGYALSCVSCISSSQALCTGSSITCGTKEVCSTIYTTTKIAAYGLTTYSLDRGCGEPSECNQLRTLSNQFMTININTGCCSSNDCTTEEPKASVDNTAPNGLVCPSCFSLTSANCVPETHIQCTGDENRCTTYSMSTDTVPPKPVLGMAGCATKNLCSDYNGSTTTNGTGHISIHITCSNATVSPVTSTIRPVTSESPSIRSSPSTNTSHVTSENPSKRPSPSTNTSHVTSENPSKRPSPSTNTSHVTGENTTTKSSLPDVNSDRSTTKSILLKSTPHGTSKSFSTNQLTTKSTEANKQTSVASGSHFTAAIVNPTPINYTSAHYTTHITFTPTAFHRSTSNLVATTHCVCKGCPTRYSFCSLSLVVIVTLIKLIY